MFPPTSAIFRPASSDNACRNNLQELKLSLTEPLPIFLKAMAVSVVVTFNPSITLACLNHLSDWVNVIWLPSEQVSPNLAKRRNWWWRLGNFHRIGLGDFTSAARLKEGGRRSGEQVVLGRALVNTSSCSPQLGRSPACTSLCLLLLAREKRSGLIPSRCSM